VNACKCKAGFSQSTDGKCVSANCFASCSTCSGSNYNQCTTCFQDSYLTNGVCTCNDGSYRNGSVCAKCSSTCATCSSALYCDTCPAGTFLWPDQLICETYCSTGYVKEGGKCVLLYNDIVQSQFDRLENNYVTTTTGIVVSMGSTDAYYPSLEANDPAPVYQRGVYLDGVDDIVAAKPKDTTVSPLVLSPTHQVIMWAKSLPSSGAQTLLYNEYKTTAQLTFSILSDGKLNIIVRTVNQSSQALGLTTLSGGSVTRSQWLQLSSRVYFRRETGTTLELFINGVKVATTSVQGSYFKVPLPDSTSVSLIGSAKSSAAFTDLFKGFIASIQITAGTSYVPTVSSNKCVSPTFCLTECSVNQYYTGTSCAECPSSCTKGCVRNSNCSLKLDNGCEPSSGSYESCTTCKALSYFDATTSKCICVANASFIESTASCQCDGSYKASSSLACVLCKAYYSPSQVSATWNSDLISFNLNFTSPVSTSSLTSCESVFQTSTLSKLGTNPSCTWTNASSLKVTMGADPKLINEKISLKNADIASSVGSCTNTSPVLEPIVNFPSQLYGASLQLSYSPSYSSSCATAPLTFNSFYKGGYGRPLMCKWTLATNPASQTISAMSEKEFSVCREKLEIGAGSLDTFNLTATIEVKNWLNLTAKGTATTAVESQKFLTVEIEGGNLQSTKRNTEIEIKAKTGAACSSNPISYSWGYVDTNATAAFNSATVLSASLKPHALLIPKDTLQAGACYNFKVGATQSGASGSATVKVCATSQPLVVEFDKSAGSVSSAVDLKVSASKSYDPDASTGSLTFRWTCAQGTGSCTAKSGSALSFESSTSELFVSKDQLKDGASYTFSATVSKDTRSTSKSITFSISGSATATLSLPQPSFKINPRYTFQLTAGVTTSSTVICKWTQQQGNSVKALTPDYYPYIQFAQNTFTEGQTYTFQLTITQGTSSCNSAITFSTNRGPTSGSLVVSPSSGIAFSTSFGLTATGFVDGDDADYPLKCQFGYGQDLYLTYPSQSTSYSTIFYEGNYNFIVRVCDALGTCTTSQAPVTVKASRRMATVNISEEFNKQKDSSTDPEQVLSLITIYAKADLTTTDYDTLKASLDSYVGQTTFTIDNVSGVLTAIENLKDHPTIVVDDRLEKLISRAEAIVDSLDELLQADFNQLMRTFSGSSTQEAEFRKSLNGIQLDSALPDSAASTTSSGNSTSYTQRVSAASFSNYAATAGNSTMKLPASNVTGVSDDNVLDVTMDHNSANGTLEVIVANAGTYSEYTFTKADKKEEKHFKDIKEPIVLSMQVPQYDPAKNYTCAYIDDSEKWTSDSTCYVDSFVEGKAVLKTFHLSKFSVVEDISTVDPDPVDDEPVEDDSDSDGACDVNFAPVGLAAGVLTFLFVGLVIISLTKKNLEEVCSSGTIVETTTHNAAHEVVFTDKVFTKVQHHEQDSALAHPEKPRNFSYFRAYFESHLLISSFTGPTKVLRLTGLITSCVVTLMQIGFLGLLYYFIKDADDPADNKFEGQDAFANYSGTDLGLAVASVFICVPFTAAFFVLMSAKASWAKIAGYILSLVMALISLAATGVLTALSCSEYSALWAVGVLYSTALEVLLLHSLFALGRVVYFAAN